MEKGRTAILYFAYSPKAEAKRKPMFASHSKLVNKQFYLELQETLFDRLTPLAYPIIHIDENMQRGTDFATRISNAVEDVWAQGFDRIMILGNDCPELKSKDFQRAADHLDGGHSCLVPTHAGGAGLIALHKDRYNAEHWQTLEWQTEGTFDELFDCLADCKVMDITLNELNTLADVYSYLEIHRNDDSELVYLIDSILNPLHHFISLVPTSIESSFYVKQKLRGPPFSA